MNNSVYDWKGNVTGFRCWKCGGIFQSMWSETCNRCRDEERRHKELVEAIKNRR